jgi:hypothetical protein
MKAYRKPAIAGIHLEFADGIWFRLLREFGFDHRARMTRVGQTPSACVHTLRSKEYDHDEI